MVKIVIHRPAQIGGQITKITTDTTSIIIDLGHNLPGTDEADTLDRKEMIEEITKGCSAVLYTHYHGDHIGLFHHVPESLPQYIGETARQVVCRKYEQLSYLPGEADKEKFGAALRIVTGMKTFRPAKAITFGDIRVTPYFVSHSACDAYMFLIEAEGKRILHTGDFRGHGYLSKGLLPTLVKHIGQVDVLIIEGTMLQRRGEKIMTEKEIFHTARKLLNDHKYVFVHCSSTDMERLAGFRNANKSRRPSRPLIADHFQKDILEIFSRTAGKQSDWFDFGKVYDLAPSFHDTPPALKEWMLREGFTLLVRPTRRFYDYISEILPAIAPEKPLFIYSMWSGYIDNPKTRNEAYIQLQNLFRKEEIKRLHTSGHASRETLTEVCEVTAPRLAIVPVHRDANADFKSIGLSPELENKVVTSDKVIQGVGIIFK